MPIHSLGLSPSSGQIELLLCLTKILWLLVINTAHSSLQYVSVFHILAMNSQHYHEGSLSLIGPGGLIIKQGM